MYGPVTKAPLPFIKNAAWCPRRSDLKKFFDLNKSIKNSKKSGLFYSPLFYVKILYASVEVSPAASDASSPDGAGSFVCVFAVSCSGAETVAVEADPFAATG